MSDLNNLSRVKVCTISVLLATQEFRADSQAWSARMDANLLHAVKVAKSKGAPIHKSTPEEDTKVIKRRGPLKRVYVGIVLFIFTA